MTIPTEAATRLATHTGTALFPVSQPVIQLYAPNPRISEMRRATPRSLTLLDKPCVSSHLDSGARGVHKDVEDKVEPARDPGTTLCVVRCESSGEARRVTGM